MRKFAILTILALLIVPIASAEVIRFVGSNVGMKNSITGMQTAPTAPTGKDYADLKNKIDSLQADFDGRQQDYADPSGPTPPESMYDLYDEIQALKAQLDAMWNQMSQIQQLIALRLVYFPPTQTTQSTEPTTPSAAPTQPTEPKTSTATPTIPPMPEKPKDIEKWMEKYWGLTRDKVKVVGGDIVGPLREPSPYEVSFPVPEGYDEYKGPFYMPTNNGGILILEDGTKIEYVGDYRYETKSDGTKTTTLPSGATYTTPAETTAPTQSPTTVGTGASVSVDVVKGLTTQIISLQSKITSMERQYLQMYQLMLDYLIAHRTATEIKSGSPTAQYAYGGESYYTGNQQDYQNYLTYGAYGAKRETDTLRVVGGQILTSEPQKQSPTYAGASGQAGSSPTGSVVYR